MADPFTHATATYQNAMRHNHKRGHAMTIRKAATLASNVLAVTTLIALGLVAWVML